MSLYAMDWNKPLQELGIQITLRILPWSTSKEESLEFSAKYETQIRVASGFYRIAHGVYQEAIDLFTEAIEIDSSCVHAFLGRAKAHELMGDYEPAYTDFDSALKLDQQCALALCGRGWTRLALGHGQAALIDCDMAVALAPAHSAFHNNLGNAKATIGDLPGALIAYEKALGLASSDSERASVLANRGTLKYIQKKPEEAMVDLRKAIRLSGTRYGWCPLLLWHCQARTEGRHTADSELHGFMSFPDCDPENEVLNWALALGGLLLGSVSNVKVTSLYELSDVSVKTERYCEMHFHLGSLAQLDGQVQVAARHFQQCMDTNVVLAPEYSCAKVALSLL